MTANEAEGDYHILVAVGEGRQLDPLLSVGCALASGRGGRVTLLHIDANGVRPPWLPPETGVQDPASSLPEACLDIPLAVKVRTGRDVGGEILDAANGDPPALILMGWRGSRGRGRYLLGRNLDPVVQFAPCNVAVVRTEEGRHTERKAAEAVERVLVPVSGGPNSPLAIDLALSLSPAVQVTALNVARDVHGQVALSLSEQRLAEMLEPWAQEPRVQGKVVQARSPIRGILAEAARDYDLVMVGASHESYLDRVLFGNIPQTVAARSPAPAIVVKHRTRRRRVGTWLRRAAWRFFDLLPALSLREQTGVYKAIRDGSQPNVDFFVMIALSAAIASLGLLLNSAAVIIGAMLVAPLMAAIFGMSLGVTRGDTLLLRRAAGATLRGVLLAIAVGLTLGVVYAAFIPRLSLQDQILGRTQPNLLDLGVALASGAAGAYALCRKEVSASLPGVAIAAALVPPLAVIGIGLGLWLVELSGIGLASMALSQTRASGGAVAGGALLLFLTNLVAITAAGALVFLWLGFRPLPGKKTRARVFQGGVLSTALLLLAVTIPLGVLSFNALKQSYYHATLQRAIEAEVGAMSREELGAMGRVELAEWQEVESDDDTVRLQVWVRSPWTVSHSQVVALQEGLAGRLQRPVELQLSVIPTTHLDPLVPPTPTATPPPGATATFTPSPTPTPTATATATNTATPTPTWTPTATPIPTNTATATATPTDIPTPTPTPTNTPTPTPTPVLAQVGGTGRQGVWMYRQPGLGGGKITAWRDGTVFTLTGESVNADGYTWVGVIDPQGRLGWIPERFLIVLGRPPG